MNKEEARQIMEGMLLGDGSLVLQSERQDAYFTLSRPDTPEFYDYLYKLAGALESLGVGLSPKCIAPLDFTRRDKDGHFLRLRTLSSPILTEWHKGWVDSDNPRHRLVPLDLKLTPLNAAIWVESDASTTWNNRKQNLVVLQLASHKFGRDGNVRLQELLRRDLGVEMNVYQDKRSGELGYHLRTASTKQVTRLLDAVHDYVQQPYLYKLKIPWPKGAETA